jgi:hypothetical protein
MKRVDKKRSVVSEIQASHCNFGSVHCNFRPLSHCNLRALDLRQSFSEVVVQTRVSGKDQK